MTLFLLFSFAYSAVSVCDNNKPMTAELLCEESAPEKKDCDVPLDEKECLGMNNIFSFFTAKAYVSTQEMCYAPYTYDKRKRKPPRISL